MAETHRANSAHTLCCCVDSQHAGEDLWGTATPANVWLLLEYAAPWGRKAFEESDLPVLVKTRLTEWLTAIARSRLQLIKRPTASARPAFFVAVAHESNPLLFEISLNAYADILDLDIPAIISGASCEETLLRHDPLFLVCTNGRRDRCCARSGFPIYQAMLRQAGHDVWQTSHLGGHRFAATAVFLPHGVMYGRISQADIAPLLDAQRTGRVYVPAYRGRSCYDPFVQAADYLLRRESGIADLGHFVLQEAQALASDQWRVTFAAADGMTHTLRIGTQPVDTLRLESCSAEQPGPISQYHLIDYHNHPSH